MPLRRPLFFTLLIASGCSTAPLAEPTNVPTAARPNATATLERPLGVAVAVGAPTVTPVLVGDYATLVRPRLEQVQQGFKQLQQQLAVLKKDPMRMAQQDWRDQTLGTLDDLALSEAELRTLGGRVTAPAALNVEMVKLLDDLDFVVSEWRMALDYDPDASHFMRAGRAELSTADEVESILSELRRPILPARTPTVSG